ncbi:hypothetical protein KFE25_012526 [Diacronema lutheri]|uniref:Uncharacterized protein n=1 Tax=Diacronema lutheri TaxID=2081491 RepID=A0A8J5XIL7_DIALT|nr:hypothetical protein KFE25_012526 [Diacronema lutheri]
MVEAPPLGLQRVLLRHEHSRGSVVGEPSHPGEGAPADADAEITPRPSTARRMAAAERSTSAGIDVRAEQLSSALEGVRVGVDGTLASLREWRAKREAQLAASRAMHRVEADDSPHAAVGTCGPSVHADPLGEGLDHAQLQRVRAMLAHGSTRAHTDEPRAQASGARAPAGDSDAMRGLVNAKVDLLSAAPPGLDPRDADLALQRRIELELLRKYGIGETDGADGATLKLQLCRYAATLDSVLDAMGS